MSSRWKLSNTLQYSLEWPKKDETLTVRVLYGVDKIYTSLFVSTPEDPVIERAFTKAPF
jgi:hypothetical protein